MVFIKGVVMSKKKLIDNHMKFKESVGKKYINLFKDLVENGQAPKSLFIGCSDSRVIPNLITNTKPGDIFVTRNIGNFIPPYDPNRGACATAAVIEYALMHLNVENIIVCGHTHCGACEALFHKIPDNEDEGSLRKWMKFGEMARIEAEALIGHANHKKLLRATEKFNVTQQLNNLLTYPAVSHKVNEGELHVMGWFYHIGSGSLDYFDPIEYRFLPLEHINKNKETEDESSKHN